MMVAWIQLAQCVCEVPNACKDQEVLQSECKHNERCEVVREIAGREECSHSPLSPLMLQFIIHTHS